METTLIWILVTVIIATLICIFGKKLGLGFLIAMFVMSILTATINASKIVMIGSFAVSASIVVYSMSFLITDTISEFWGKKQAKTAALTAIIASLCFLVITQMSLSLTPAPFWDMQAAFEQVLGNSWRIVLASIIALGFAQYNDVFVFHAIKSITGDKYLWLRNNISTFTSQVIDTMLFYTIAFYGVFPITELIIGTLIVKAIIALIDTPFLYVVRMFYKRE